MISANLDKALTKEQNMVNKLVASILCLIMPIAFLLIDRNELFGGVDFIVHVLVACGAAIALGLLTLTGNFYGRCYDLSYVLRWIVAIWGTLGIGMVLFSRFATNTAMCLGFVDRGKCTVANAEFLFYSGGTLVIMAIAFAILSLILRGVSNYEFGG
jgi:hypothetical protein